MMMPSLVLPTVKGDVAAARQRLGRGLRMSYQVGELRGELRLEPGAAPMGVQPLCFETACGVLGFSEPGPQFSLLGECPVTLAQAGNDLLCRRPIRHRLDTADKTAFPDQELALNRRRQ